MVDEEKHSPRLIAMAERDTAPFVTFYLSELSRAAVIFLVAGGEGPSIYWAIRVFESLTDFSLTHQRLPR
jgi:hypothetical protein